LALQKAANFRRRIVGERLLVLSAGNLGIFAAPLDDPGVTHAHRDVEIHCGAIDQTRNAARFLCFAAETLALRLQVVGGTLASLGLLVEKARKIFLADIERRVVIALLTVDANRN
jgi:hypothetical protein